MDITLYYTPKTRSLRPRWLLEELKIPYKIQPVDLFGGEGQSEEYRKINPLGAVPAIKVNDKIMLESGAICHWLADFFSDAGLAPSVSDISRMDYEKWMYFSQATLEMPPWLVILHSQILPQDSRVEDIVPWARQRYQSILPVLQQALMHRDYLLEDGFSTADIMIGSTLMWLPDELANFPELIRYVDRLKQRPAYQKATH